MLTKFILQWYSKSLHAVESGNQIPVEARFLKPVQTGPGHIQLPVPYVLCLFPRVKWPMDGGDPRLHTAPSYRHSTAIPLLTLWNCMACSYLTFTLLLNNVPDYTRLKC